MQARRNETGRGQTSQSSCAEKEADRERDHSAENNAKEGDRWEVSGKVSKPYKDPYSGHGVEPNELQRVWETKVEEMRKQKRNETERITATERIRMLRARIRERQGRDQYHTDDKLARHIDKEAAWFRDKEVADRAAAEMAHPAAGIGSIPPKEANGHVLRTNRCANEHTWVWCAKCGAFTNERVRTLASECQGWTNTQQKRRLEDSRNLYTNRSDFRRPPRDMAWTDADALRILEDCNNFHAETDDHCEQWNRRHGDVWEHYEECTLGPIDGHVMVDDDDAVQSYSLRCSEMLCNRLPRGEWPVPALAH